MHPKLVTKVKSENSGGRTPSVIGERACARGVLIVSSTKTKKGGKKKSRRNDETLRTIFSIFSAD